MIGGYNIKRNGNIGIEIVNQNNVWGTGEKMNDPAHHWQVGRFGGEQQEVTATGLSQQPHEGAKAKKKAIDDATSDTIRPES
jgi:hypothetical protein